MPSDLVDLRSDTVTQPTPEMRRAMAEAEVGDDTYGEDPTVNALEAAYADRVGKPAALFVPSGTMANQIAVRVQAPPGSLVVAGRRQHVVAYELGAAAQNAGVQFHGADDRGGVLSAAEVAWAREAAQYHQPALSLVCVENTHMSANGAPWDLAALRAVRAAAGPVPVHMDGARLFNAEVATAVPAAEMAATATTVMSCLSKGLCAPVGSVLAGPADVIAAGRLARKRLGGGMRQAGILAAAGLVALDRMVDRLADDHARAARLAAAVADRWPDAGLDPAAVRTNIVVFSPPSPATLLDHLAGEGVLAGMVGPGLIRLVTHHDVDDAGTDRAVAALRGAP
ncbi:MAG TPA: GntG family PLP-dependent aldolase [Acidimicrobiales bacterium]|nr:GntG family PLP-dependent aldolase [Acidimicrobiales bacterium]